MNIHITDDYFPATVGVYQSASIFEHSEAAASEAPINCNVTFKIHYETSLGENLCVLGSIPELGEWEKVRCRLTWTQGHVWVLQEPLRLSGVRSFSYKYMICNDDSGEHGQWEQGVDRIADL